MRPAVYKIFALLLFSFHAAFADTEDKPLTDELLAIKYCGAVGGWQAKTPVIFGGATSVPVLNVSILSNKLSSVRSGVVPLSNGGYVVIIPSANSSTSANNRPSANYNELHILAVSTSGSFDDSSPLGKMLTGQIPELSKSEDIAPCDADASSVIRVSSGGGSDEQLVKTIDLTKLDLTSFELGDDAPENLKTGLEAVRKMQSQRKGETPVKKGAGEPFGLDENEVGDIRVRPLLKTAWGQDSVFSKYTPSNYVCGCVATMLGQVMYYHKYPAGQDLVISNRIYVDGVATRAGMQTGTYDWDAMTLTSAGLSSDDKAAIEMGKLVFNAGVSVHMQYSADGSGSYMPDAYSALTNKNSWAYTNAVIFSARDASGPVGIDFNYHTGATWDMVLGSLNAGYPVCMGISGKEGGHAIVCDGYGFLHDTNGVEDVELLYLHLNLGWDGSGNAWYNMPVFVAAQDMMYTKLDEVIYNIFPTNSGEVVSGRIVDIAGAPVTNAIVTVTLPDSTSYTVDTSDTGVWSVIVPSDTNCSVSVSAPEYKSASTNDIQISRSINEMTTYGKTGNIWNCDFTLQDADNADVVFTPYSDEGYLFTDSVEVSLSCEQIGGTPDPEIWYSTNGVDYVIYEGPFTLSVSTEISAYGVYSSVTGKTFTAKYISDSLANGIDDETNGWVFTDSANWARVEGYYVTTLADPLNDDCAMCISTVPGQTNSVSVAVDGEGTLSFALGGYFLTDDVGFVGVAIDGKYTYLIGTETNKYDSLAAGWQRGSAAKDLNNANWTNIVLDVTGDGPHTIEIVFVSDTIGKAYAEMGETVTHQITDAYINKKAFPADKPLKEVFGVYMLDRLVWTGSYGVDGWSVLTPNSMMASMTVDPTANGKVLTCVISEPISEIKVNYSATLSPPAFQELPSTYYEWDAGSKVLNIPIPQGADSGFYIIYYK